MEKELYILPLLIKNNEILIFNNNLFYNNWNNVYKNDLIEFILPIENIEIIQNINNNKNNLLNLDIKLIFKEYTNKNLALVFINEDNFNINKVYIKTKIQGKNISKNLNFPKKKLDSKSFNEMIIVEIKKELINLVKSQNLIDIRTPSFLNVKLSQSKKSNLNELKARVKNIDLIENVYVQEFNKDYVNLKIKYLGKLEKIINRLKDKEINLQLVNDQWIIKTL